MSRLLLERADAEPLAFEETLDVDRALLGEDAASNGTVTLSGTVEKGQRGYWMFASADGSVSLTCVRCLEEFPFTFKERLELHLLPVEAAPQDDETRLGRDDMDVVFTREGEIDLGEVAAEQFHLAVPMKPVCSRDCKGLCPRCGANRNQTECGCQPEQDERWTPLAGWQPSN